MPSGRVGLVRAGLVTVVRVMGALATGLLVTGCTSVSHQEAPVVTSAHPAITSQRRTSVPLGSPLSFRVKVSGHSRPTITESGTLPPGVVFVDQGNHSATLSGTPTEMGTYHLTIRAAFDRESTPDVLTQHFTLIVGGPAPSGPLTP